MASPISNTVQSPNPFSGFLGLTPKSKTQNMQTTTPGVISTTPAKPQTNFGNLVNNVTNGINTVKGIIPTALGNEAKAIGNAASGAFNYLNSPAGTSYGQANPNSPFQIKPLLPTPGTPAQQTAAPANIGDVNSIMQSNGATQNQSTNVPRVTQQPNIDSSISMGNTFNPNYDTQTQGTGTAPTTSSRGLFPNVVSSLAGIGQNGSQAVQQATQNIKQLQDSDAAENARISSSVYGAGDLGGQRGILERAYTSRLGNAQSALTNALQGQGQQISALGSAASQTKPEANFPFIFNPDTGTFSAPGTTGGSGASAVGPSLTYNPQQDSQSLAQSVMNHQIGYSDALAALSYGSNGANAAGQLSSAILAAGGNPTILQTQAGIQNQQEQTYQEYQSAHQQALNLQSQLTDLITKFGLNPSDLGAANLALQKIAKNISDPRYQLLSNYLSDVASRYSQILTPPGGSATDTTRSVATGMLNGLSGGHSIIDVMNGLDQQAQAVSAGVKTIGNNSSQGSSSTGSNITWDNIGD